MANNYCIKLMTKFVFICEKNAWRKYIVSGIFHAILSVTILWLRTI